MPPPFGHDPNRENRPPKPKTLREVPHYLHELIFPTLGRLGYIFRLVWEAKKSMLFLLMFMALFNGIAPVIGSIISAEILNDLARVYSGVALAFSVITVLLVYQFAYMFLRAAVTRVNSVIMTLSGEVVANHVKMKIMNKARTIDMVSYDMPEFYSKMENANREAGMRPLQVMDSTFQIVSALISIISYIVVLFAVNAWAPLLIIAVAIPETVINFIYRRKNVEYMFFSSKNRRKMDYYANTVVNKDLAKEIRMLGLGDVFVKKYQDTFEDYYKGLKKLRYQDMAWNLAASVLTNVVYCILYILLARGVYDGVYEVGNFSLYTGAINAIGTGVSSLITTTAGIYEGTLFINNLMAFLNEKARIVPSLPQPRKLERHVGHRLSFENVSFSYPGTERRVIRDMSFTIEPGETVVIVGLNGAGKTTLVKLLMRLYDPSEGRVLLDGHDIREYDPEDVYAMFGVVFQDFGKYAVTASENIEFGDLEKTGEPELVHKAAEQSGADTFIQKLPLGYDTPLMRYFETEGIELSIGQWQKLSIARAFYSDSDVLILDEPTASLDPLAEQDIFNRFYELRKGRTGIFISHRLSTATTADKILVIEDGQLIEYGSHAELMAQGGRYHELFTTQAKRYIEQPPIPEGMPAFAGGFPGGGMPGGFPAGGFPGGMPGPFPGNKDATK